MERVRAVAIALSPWARIECTKARPKPEDVPVTSQTSGAIVGKGAWGAGRYDGQRRKNRRADCVVSDSNTLNQSIVRSRQVNVRSQHSLLASSESARSANVKMVARVGDTGFVHFDQE